MKKTIFSSLALLLSMSMIFTGCSSSKESAQEQPAAKEQSSATVLKLAHMNATDSPIDKGAKKFAELVDKGTNGKVKVEVYDNGQLGPEKQILDSVKVGVVDMVITGDAVFSAFTPEYGGLSQPYLFRDLDHLH